MRDRTEFTIATCCAFAPFVVGIALAACTPTARRDAAKTALDVVDVSCVFAHAALGEDAPAISDGCKLAHALDPVVRRLVSEQRAAALAGCSK